MTIMHHECSTLYGGPFAATLDQLSNSPSLMGHERLQRNNLNHATFQWLGKGCNEEVSNSLRHKGAKVQWLSLWAIAIADYEASTHLREKPIDE